jgi:PAS domain S-box-containing protein
LPDPDGLSPSPDQAASAPSPSPSGVVPAREEGLRETDRGAERRGFYLVLFAILGVGSLLLRGDVVYESGYAAHSVMEAIATLLAFIVGALALVRYYSRKRITFLLIGCGFLGAALLDLNHALRTSEWYIGILLGLDPSLNAENVFSWSWTAERVFLSTFLFWSFLASRQEGAGDADVPEVQVYVTALVMTVAMLLFFESVPGAPLTRPEFVLNRPTELLPALLFALTFVGFYRKGRWRTDPFEHWLLVSLLLSSMAHAAFMASSTHRFDAVFDAAHLLKVTSYVAILSGLLVSVYDTFRREEHVLGALTDSNEALAREIEVRTRTERAVKESSQRLQAFLDNANDLIQSTAPDGRILYVNSSWKQVLGYSDDDLERLNLFDIVHPAHRFALEREFERVLGGGAPERFPIEYVAADGRIVILSGSSQAVLQDGKPIATQSILRDVTEQRLAERRLAESQEKLEALVENTGDSIWSVDRDHRVMTLNSAFALAMEARTGHEPRVGQLPTEVFAPEDVQWYTHLYERTLAGERGVALRTDDVDGQLRYFEMYANPIQSIEGVSGAVFFGKDVTPRVRAEEALRVAKEEAEAANKAKSDFLANMSHELRTPLNSVIGFTNILLKNKEDRLTEKDVGFLERVLSNGKHLLALINEVLDLAKVEAGRMELIIEDVDLAHLCVETVQQLEGQAKTKDGAVKLLHDVPESVAMVKTDSAKLKQVIINLVGNALKFTHEGSVTVRLDLAPDRRTPVAIAVVDTGIGIPEDRLEAIFEAFQQAEAGTSRKYGGTGLGLALSRSICLLMGYDLMVESVLGGGSTFRIVLGERAERPTQDPQQDHFDAADFMVPSAEIQAPSAPVAAPGAEWAGSGQEPVPAVVSGPSWSDFKVLIVDDERDSRVLIQHFLEEFGCQVFTAQTGERGLELAREHRPDLITLDLIMPGMTGWEVLKHLKADAALRPIPVVVVSVVAGEGRGRLLGAVDLVTKPFDREDLLRVLWRNLGRRRGGRVLVMVADGAVREEVAQLVEARGLEVVAVTKDSPMHAIRRHAPDAVVLDLAVPAAQGVTALLELRDDRLHTGLPVMVIADDRLDPKDLAIVRDLATVHSDPAGAITAVTRLLDAVFPLVGAIGPAE